jgi:hypothetical protein
MKVKVTIHCDRGRYVVNTPGSHLQRRPRTYGTLARAMGRVQELETLAVR